MKDLAIDAQGVNFKKYPLYGIVIQISGGYL